MLITKDSPIDLYIEIHRLCTLCL